MFRIIVLSLYFVYVTIYETRWFLCRIIGSRVTLIIIGDCWIRALQKIKLSKSLGHSRKIIPIDSAVSLRYPSSTRQNFPVLRQDEYSTPLYFCIRFQLIPPQPVNVLCPFLLTVRWKKIRAERAKKKGDSLWVKRVFLVTLFLISASNASRTIRFDNQLDQDIGISTSVDFWLCYSWEPP